MTNSHLHYLQTKRVVFIFSNLNGNFNLCYVVHPPAKTEKGLNLNIILVGMNMKKMLSSSSSSSCEEIKLWKP